MIDVQDTCRKVHADLGAMGFAPRDADDSDLHRPNHDGDMRCKVGTSYGEVAIQVWYGKNRFKVLRITQPKHYAEVMAEIEDLANPVVEVVMTEESEEPVAVYRVSDFPGEKTATFDGREVE